MGCEYANLLLTDPPYNVDYHGTSGSIKNDNFKSEDAFKDFLTDAFKSASSKMMPGAAFYVWFASVHSPSVYTAIQEGGLLPKQELEWVKSQFTLGRQDYQWAHEPCVYGWKDGAAHYFAPLRNEWSVIDDAMNTRKMTKTQLREALENILTNGIETTVLRYAKPASSELHPTTKPVKLFARLIQNSSRENEIVLDIFGGSGTTMMAAEQLHRRAFLMELDPHYCDVIIKRWESLTGMKAEKAS
jgi:site-specific DNA-methyltransferase (adenine-specific)